MIGKIGVTIFCNLWLSVSNVYSQTVKPTIHAHFLEASESVIIDGIINENIWHRIQYSSDFIQTAPNDGESATERTEVRVAYDHQYLYVAINALDSVPDSIASSLFRRDGRGYSDWLYVSIDSYNDKRTAFSFAVNPKGVQKDIFHYDDDKQDIKWDAVWDVATAIHENGWSAEFRIPFSQLRFNSTKGEQVWGINFERYIARKEETSNWAHNPREEFGKVSWFGRLHNIKDLKRPLRLEIVPYISGSNTNAPTPEKSWAGSSDPFYNKNDLKFKAGGDIQYGITSDLTLTATINPDFGQVEADPSTINLTQFETYFAERRPFFLEGSDIFTFGGSNSSNSFSTHQTFYSRRIGRSPYGNPSMAGIAYSFEDRPTQSTIAAATKVTGKNKNGLSIGILDAYTLKERAHYFDEFNGGKKGKYTIEPPTNYLVARVKQDIKGGDAQIGAFGSAVNRNMEGGYLEDYLHSSAYQFGVDGQYNWANRSWGASGSFALSQVNGSQTALLATQKSPTRYYQRVDSDYLKIDPTKTSLTGYTGEFSIGKYAGSGLRYSFTYSETSPSYEVNDIGYQDRADYRAPHFYFDYLQLKSDFFRYYLLWTYGGYAWNFDGDLVMNFYGAGGYFQFKNLWTMNFQSGLTGTFYNDRITRGGPIMRRPKDWNASIDVSTNATKNFYMSLGGAYRADASGEYTRRVSTSFNYRPTGYVQLQLAATYHKEKNTDQYLGFFEINNFDDEEYVFTSSNIDLFYITMRLDWTFSPKLSLQTYVRPQIYTAAFSDLKTFSERKTYNFTPSSALDPSGFDFDFNTLQGNAVLRWEYRPGSTIYFVWQQQRQHDIYGQSKFRPYSNAIDLMKEEPTNIFLIKLSYWFGS